MMSIEVRVWGKKYSFDERYSANCYLDKTTGSFRSGKGNTPEEALADLRRQIGSSHKLIIDFKD
jgi:hypothetical protein